MMVSARVHSLQVPPDQRPLHGLNNFPDLRSWDLNGLRV